MSPPRMATVLCGLMLLMSISPVLMSTSAQETGEEDVAVDTGWIRIDVAENGTGDFHHLVPYGIQMKDITFEVRIDGENDLFLMNPEIYAPEAGASLLDWSNGPGLGRLLDFTAGDPHNGRMAPRSDTSATWTLPEGATVQSVLMEALRPVDPLVSLAPYVLDIQATAIHPDDGRIYIAIDDSLLMLDATSSPPIIDRIENVQLVALSLVGSELIGLSASNAFHCWSLDDGSICSPRASIPVSHLSSDGNWAAGPGVLYQHGPTGWTEVITTESNGQWPDEPVTDLRTQQDMILVATDGGGIARFNQHSAVRETTWSTANVLPSDRVVEMVAAGGTLFVATADAGVARMDMTTGSWLAVWHGGNWLQSSNMVDLTVEDGLVYMLSDAGLDVYDTSSGSFSGSAAMSEMGLNADGMDLAIWPAGQSRSPTQTALLVSDGSGRLAVLDADAAPQAIGDLLLATTPTNAEVHQVLELSGILYAAGDVGIDRFDIRARTWLQPLLPENGVHSMVSDGSRIFSVGDDLPVDVWARNGSLEQTISLGMSAEPTSLSWDALTGSLLITLGEEGLARVKMSDGSIDIWNENDDFQRGWAFEVVARNGIAYVAVEGEGIARVNLSSEEILGSWRSSGVDEVEQAPIAISGDRVYLGLYDAGVFVFDRDTGEMVETWAQDEEEWWWWEEDGSVDNSAFTQLPNPWVLELHVDQDGDVYVGHESGFVRRTADGFESSNSDDGWFFGARTPAITSTASNVYALQEWQGLCTYARSDLHLRECWNARPNSDIVIDVTGGQSLSVPAPNRLFVSTDHGAYLIDTLNESILQEWSTGGSTWNTPVVVYDEIAHLAVDGVGIARYDLASSQWLETWNEVGGQLPDNGVTALSDDVTANHLWVGGDFGLLEIDMDDASELNLWDQTTHPTVPRWAAQQLVRIDDVLHLLETPPERRDGAIIDIIDGLGDSGAPEGANGRQRPNQGAQPATRIFRYDVVNEEQLTNLNPVGRFSNELSIIGMENFKADELWIGVGKPYAWHWTEQAGGIARWDANAGHWLADIEPDATGGNTGIAALIGECDATSLSADPDGCHVLTSYGDEHHRLIAMNGDLEFEPDLGENVRAAVTWDGHGLLATAAGVLRIDVSDWTMADPWEAGDGLPPSASDNTRALEVIDGDLWAITKTSSSTSSSKIHRLDGATNQWMTWSASSVAEIPDGTGVTIEQCGDVIHFGITGEMWNAEGGIARYDVLNDEWLDPLESFWRGDVGPDPGEEGLTWSSVNALACDDEDVLYIGVDESGYGIQRYDVAEDEWMETLSSWEHGISESAASNNAMEWADGTLAIGHFDSMSAGWSEGAFSLISVRGEWVGAAHISDEGITSASVTPWPQLPGGSADWLVAQPGASGPGRAKLFNSIGDSSGLMDSWTGLVDGRARHFAGNATHVYAALLADEADRTDGAATILEGVQVGEGDIEWQRSWSLQYASIERLLQLGDDLYVTTRHNGLWRIDLATGEMDAMPPTAHDSLSMMTVHDGDIIVGFSAVEMAAGLGVFDTAAGNWDDSALLPGLPSPIVRDMAEADGHIWFATPGGIGSWNIADGDWGPSISAGDGLGSGDVHSLALSGGELWAATTGGLCAVRTSTVDTTGPSVRQCMTRNQGLVGSSTADLATAGGMLYASHDGFGPTRPGATQVRSIDRNAMVQYHADSLPSNDVTAIAADGWGVHIATDEEPLSHWNAITNQMESGAIAADTGGWPITSLASDGRLLTASTTGLMHRISVQAVGHPVVNTTGAPGIVATHQGALGTWAAAGDQGVWPFGPASGYEVLPQVVDRRATPLRISLGSFTSDITAEARPSNRISFDPDTMIGTDTTALTLVEFPLIFSSDIDGAAVWATTEDVRYNGSWDLAATQEGMRAILFAVAFGATNDSGHDLHLQFAGEGAGAVEVRLSYIAVTSNSPVQMLLLEDRPNDGGDALVATWTPTMEAGFTAYELSVDDGTQVNTITIPDRFNVQTVISGLDSNTAYNVWVEVVYSNGNHSNSSNTIGPVTPFDDIPLAPAWGNAEFRDHGSDGEVLIEWEYCSALDHYFSLHYVFLSPPSPLTSYQLGQGIGQGGNLPDNQTIHAATGAPIWVMIYCVDAAGQIDLANPLILGPISTSGDNDTEAPAPVEWVKAMDHPDDLGGALDITWAASVDDDCALYSVHLMPVNGAWPPMSADAAEVVEWITDCSQTSTTIEGLADGQAYWVTVVAHDASLNADLLNSPWATGMPLSDLTSDAAPERVLMVTASDVADDSGHAITVSWSPVMEADLAHYTVWVSEHDVSNVSGMWGRCSFYLDTCAEMVMAGMVAGQSAPTITLERALYGEMLAGSVRNQIMPGTELFVVVTAHDAAGNVFLDDLVMASVMPIDDLLDDVAPARMDRPILSDVANDDGRALWMEFTPSAADDVAWYAVYVEAETFTDACGLQPAMLLPIDAEQPVLLTRYATGRFLEPGEAATVGIVAVDGSANALCGDVSTSNLAPVNDGEPPSSGPPVVGLKAEWIDNGTGLKLTWARTDGARGGLSIHLSSSRFAVAGEAELIATGIEGDFFIIEDIDSSQTWWLALTNDHSDGQIIEVEPIEIQPFGVDSTTSDDGFESIDLIIGGTVALLILVALSAFFVMRKGRRDESLLLDHAGLVADSMDQSNEMWKAEEDPLPELNPEVATLPTMESELPSMAASTENDPFNLDDLI